MKVVPLFVASLAIAILPIPPANAENKCSGSSWPAMSPVQCSKPMATSYVQCLSMLEQKGWDARTTWWYCSSQGFKS